MVEQYLLVEGNVNLLGNYVSNSGTITARLGKFLWELGKK